jgi:hypothetical protein
MRKMSRGRISACIRCSVIVAARIYSRVNEVETSMKQTKWRFSEETARCSKTKERNGLLEQIERVSLAYGYKFHEAEEK